ncbi:hypothetical protein K7W03_27760, partial [Sphingobium sp. PNB]|uniref:hypothetical protein n=1 Tax=Sphingobium sp. PNB TaxID=863934 RepID=UPI001CA46505
CEPCSLHSSVLPSGQTLIKLGGKSGGQVSGLLADLMRHPADYHYRSLHPSGFKRAAVGYRPFMTAIQGMKALGYLEVVMGFWQPGRINQPGMATRYRLTPTFLKYAADFGICAVDWSGHFRPPPMGSYNPNPVLVRSAAVKDWNKRVRGALARRLTGCERSDNQDENRLLGCR